MDFRQFKNKYQKKEVVEFPNKVDENPLVSISVPTFQHARFITECLEGIVIQKTDFQFEILLGEDGSTDGTREICLDYAKNYPEKIRLFLHHRENNIKIKGKATGRFNVLYNYYAAKGKYIALCEGDDYWTDPLKLQKQVDFLEANKDYNICFHRSKILKDGNLLLHEVPSPFTDKAFLYVELLKQYNFILTGSVLFKNLENSMLPEWLLSVPFGDLAIYKIMSQEKKIYCINEVMSVYRIHENGVWSLLKPIEAKNQYLDFYKKIYFHLNHEEQKVVYGKIKDTLFQISNLKSHKSKIWVNINYRYKLMIFNIYKSKFYFIPY